MSDLIYAGQIEEKKESNAYNDAGDKVINLVVGYSREILGTGIFETVKRTVVLFRKDAEKAINKLSEGDFAIFSAAQRNPRVYENKKGMEVKTVDVRADGFVKITKKQYQDNLETLQQRIIPETDLQFTDEDDKMLKAAAEKAKAKAAEAAATENTTEGVQDAMPV